MKQFNRLYSIGDTLRGQTLAISFWAKNHPILSWAIITFGRVTLGLIAFSWGFVLALGKQGQSQTFFAVSAMLFLLGFAAYPAKKYGRHRLGSFVSRKCCDALLVASSFMAWLGVGSVLPEWGLPGNSTPHSKVAQLPVLQSAMARPFEFWHSEAQSTNEEGISSNRGGFFHKIKAWKQFKIEAAKTKIRYQASKIRAARKQIEPEKVALLIFASLVITLALG